METILATFTGAFIGNLVFDKLKKKKQKKREINIAACACEVQGIMNHLRRTGQPIDPYIKKTCDKLWELVENTPSND